MYTSFYAKKHWALDLASVVKASNISSNLHPGRTKRGSWHKSLSLTKAFTKQKTSRALLVYHDGRRSSAVSKRLDGIPGTITINMILAQRQWFRGRTNAKAKTDLNTNWWPATFSANKGEAMRYYLLISHRSPSVSTKKSGDFWKSIGPVSDICDIFHLVVKSSLGEEWCHLV